MGDKLMHIQQMIKPALQSFAIIGTALCASQIALAQTPAAQDAVQVSSCIPADEMLERFLARDIDDLPHYGEREGMRLQNQHQATHMYLHAKYIEGNDTSIAICQYANNAGVVASYAVRGAYADASDGNCGSQYCVQGAYWRKESSEASQEDDRPGEEYIYTCMRDLEDGRQVPSGACGFSPPEN
ncbi:MAG: hypothetical protein ABJG15_00905 [Hyphomonadaceae bacterium]